MKVAFLAVIVVVLAIQGSEAILGLPLPAVPGLGGGITLDPIINAILSAVQGLLGQLPVPAGALPCQLVDIVPSITLFTDLIGADYKKAATVIIKCPQQVSCTLYAKVDLSAIEAAVKLECDAPGILPGPNPTVVEVKVSLKGLPGLPLPPLPILPL